MRFKYIMLQSHVFILTVHGNKFHVVNVELIYRKQCLKKEQQFFMSCYALLMESFSVDITTLLFSFSPVLTLIAGFDKVIYSKKIKTKRQLS